MAQEVDESTEQEAPPAVVPVAAAPGVPKDDDEDMVLDLKGLLKNRKGQPSTISEVLPYVILTDMMDRRQDRAEERQWRREQRALKGNAAQVPPSPEVKELENQVKTLSQTVTSLLDSMKEKEKKSEQAAFVTGVVKETTASIMPTLNALATRLQAIETKTATAPATSSDVEELKEIRDSLRGVVDKIGETAGSKGVNMENLTQVMDVIEKLEKRFGKGAGAGEVDVKTMAISAVTEVGKELIAAYRDVSAQGGGETAAQQPGAADASAASATVIQTMIKRQVQTYVMQRMEEGATTLNVQKAAADLGISAPQVVWAYQQLEKEGWFQVKGKPGERREKTEQETTAAAPEAAAAAHESDQVFHVQET